jgi:putative membrane protein
MRFLARLLLNGIAIIITTYLVPGLHVAGPGAAVLAGVFLGFINAIVRPVLLFLTFPITLITLGLFIFVINALCLLLTAYIVPGIQIDTFGAAVIGALSVSIISWILSAVLVGKKEKKSA